MGRLQKIEDEDQTIRLGVKHNSLEWTRKVVQAILRCFPSENDGCLDTVAAHLQRKRILDTGAGRWRGVQISDLLPLTCGFLKAKVTYRYFFQSQKRYFVVFNFVVFNVFYVFSACGGGRAVLLVKQKYLKNGGHAYKLGY